MLVNVLITIDHETENIAGSDKRDESERSDIRKE